MPEPDVALHQPVHRDRAGQVLAHLADHAVLCTGGLERELVAQLSPQCALGADDRRAARILRGVTLFHAGELVGGQLLQCQARACGPALLGGVQCVKGLGPRRGVVQLLQGRVQPG